MSLRRKKNATKKSNKFKYRSRSRSKLRSRSKSISRSRSTSNFTNSIKSFIKFFKFTKKNKTKGG